MKIIVQHPICKNQLNKLIEFDWENTELRILNTSIIQSMNLPKFVLADNSEFPDDIFVIHLDYPRFIINLTNDEVEIFDDVDDEDERELEAEMEDLIQQAGAFYDREMEEFE